MSRELLVVNDTLLVDELLARQRQLTAVETFASAHDAGVLPLQGNYYASLIPDSPPGVGQQYAFAVDLDRCTGCKACVTGCHSRNGLEPGETWRHVGVLSGERDGVPVQQTVTTACHHCADPGCLSGCPVQAYDKDPLTGIVHHLDDQCIGCQYCTMTCPYDVPQYSASKGIVRKCDMCAERLGAGEAPACVQSCPNQAIEITVVDSSRLAADAAANFAPIAGAPDACHTGPSTVYRTRQPQNVALAAGDRDNLQPQHAHWPLVGMLVLSQAGVGLLLAASLLPLPPLREVGALAGALLLTLAGLGIAPLHLGQPLKAWKVFLGLRTSWLSREMLVFGGFVPVLAALLAARAGWLPWAPAGALNVLALAFGAAGVICSAMIYMVTPRVWWASPATLLRFFLTGIMLGSAALLLPLPGALPKELLPVLVATIMLATAVQLVVESSVLRHRHPSAVRELQATAQLLTGPLRPVWLLRLSLAVAAGLVLPVALLLVDGATVVPLIALLCAVGLLAAEVAGRYLFFVAVAPRRMPGLANS